MIPRQHHYRKFPDLMSKSEIVQFFSVIDNLRDRAIFETIYGSGLRISEIVKLRVQDIDSVGMRIFIYQEGKAIKTGIRFYHSVISNFCVNIGNNIVQIIRKAICSMPDPKASTL